MKKYNGLLEKISSEYGIKRGGNESDEKYKARIIYSICGLMGYASLWDETETGNVTIEHMRHRIESVYRSYKEMYPEAEIILRCSEETLSKEIYNVFCNTGVIYHSPYYVAPAVYSEAEAGSVCFRRGIVVDDIKNASVSGIGVYSQNSDGGTAKNVSQMFGLQELSLQTLWNETVSHADWTPLQLINQNVEYLKMKAPFSEGYWTRNQVKGDITSILRLGFSPPYLYYLYRKANNTIEISQLMNWQTESGNYRSLACACINKYGSLPSIKYKYDGELVHIRLGYLLPPRELNFLKLYSWPTEFDDFKTDFRRECSDVVFKGIKDVLTNEGYNFEEE